MCEKEERIETAIDNLPEKESLKKSRLIKFFDFLGKLPIYIMLIIFVYRFLYHLDWDNTVSNIMRARVESVEELNKYLSGEEKIYFFDEGFPIPKPNSNEIVSVLKTKLPNGKSITIKVYSDRYGMFLRKTVEIDGKIVSEKKYVPEGFFRQLSRRIKFMTIIPN